MYNILTAFTVGEGSVLNVIKVLIERNSTRLCDYNNDKMGAVYRTVNKRSGYAWRWFAIVLLFVLAGCGGGTTIRYINPAANFSYIKKVAVLPFNNLSNDKYAAERVRSVVIVDLMSRGLFDVMEQGEVTKVLNVIFREAGIEEGRAVQIDKDTLKIIGDRLGVQAVILGSVDEYATSPTQKGGVVSISLRMIDTSSGIILWQANATESGASVWRKIVGLEEVDRSKLTRGAVRKALDTLM